MNSNERPGYTPPCRVCGKPYTGGWVEIRKDGTCHHFPAADQTPQTPQTPQKHIQPSIIKWMVCKKCHQRGVRGQSPFTTAPQSGLCDDCF